VVVTEKARAAKSSNYKELIGNYNPHTNAFNVDEERVKYWMGVGAQVSPTLHNLLVTNGLIKGDKINVLPKKSPVVKEEKETEEKTEKADEETPEDAVKEAAEVARDEEEPVEEKAEEAPKEDSEEKEDKKSATDEKSADKED
jgi:small subunit ribosomal protein S16